MFSILGVPVLCHCISPKVLRTCASRLSVSHILQPESKTEDDTGAVENITSGSYTKQMTPSEHIDY